MSKLYNLQTLKLYGCVLLKALPVGFQDLVNLCRLDIRETSLEEMPKGMSRLRKLQILSDFIVGKHDGNRIRELGPLADLHGTLCIKNLENITNGVEAWEARMGEKKNIDVLDLNWSPDVDVADSLIERDVLDKLQPHNNLQELLHASFTRTDSFSEVLTDFRSCCLPSIGAEFYKNGESCWETPFPSLETLYFNRMSCWKEWHSIEQNAFPQLKELNISDCSVLAGNLPDHLPSLEKLTVIGCEQLACSLPRAPMLSQLSILGSEKVRMQELPLSLCSLQVGGSDLVESVMESISHSGLIWL
ncbi:hypothetical protein PIB30_023540 [Stylosanthes scabra]|uniref:R13L1/DRL21-like LRR repeat region domain-containing protein n=1 Tax=Stylosanthes scabra TaxID=79078 RepID=A0ABU6VAZ9_9FABA|nr:hypothetical protein [Stylosanthes scabra]